MKLMRIILTVLLCIAPMVGDYVVFKSKYSESQVFRAFTDSSVHAVIGLLSALLFFTHEIGLTGYARLFYIVFCTILSSLIDIDHFIAARSLRLKDLAHLKQRGIFHCTTFWFLLTATLILYTQLTKRLNVYIITFMTILAYSSHHIRDANRRGLWMYPFGHTPPLSKYLYIFLLATLPRITAYLYITMKPTYKHTVVYYDAPI